MLSRSLVVPVALIIAGASTCLVPFIKYYPIICIYFKRDRTIYIQSSRCRRFDGTFRSLYLYSILETISTNYIRDT